MLDPRRALAIAVGVPAWRGEVFILVLVHSAVIAHAPGEERGLRLVLGGQAPLGRGADSLVRPV